MLDNFKLMKLNRKFITRLWKPTGIGEAQTSSKLACSLFVKASSIRSRFSLSPVMSATNRKSKKNITVIIFNILYKTNQTSVTAGKVTFIKGNLLSTTAIRKWPAVMTILSVPDCFSVTGFIAYGHRARVTCCVSHSRMTKVRLTLLWDRFC